MSEHRLQQLEKNLIRILDALKAHYAPEQVIVFGSLASGNVTETSDLDLLIVVRGLPRSRFERGAGLSKLARQISSRLAEAVMPLWLTPEEARSVKPYYLGMLSGHEILWE